MSSNSIDTYLRAMESENKWEDPGFTPDISSLYWSEWGMKYDPSDFQPFGRPL